MVGNLMTLLLEEAQRIWYFRWLVAVTAIVLFGASAAYILHRPPVYETWGQIYVERRASLKAATDDIKLGDAGDVQVMSKALLLNDVNLEAVLRQRDPKAAYTPASLDRAINGLRNSLDVTDLNDDGFVQFTAHDTNPARARQTVDLVMKQFVAASMGRSAADLDQATRFLDQQIADLQDDLSASQTKIAEFRRLHPGVTAQNAQETALTSTVVTTSAPAAPEPAAPAGAAPAPRPAFPDQGRIDELEERIASLKTQYTDQYPDVVAARRQLATLLAARTQFIANLPPVQIQPAAVASAPRAAAQPRQVVVRRAVARPLAPEVAADWASLQTDDARIRDNLQRLVGRRDAAKISEAVFGSDNTGRFQVTHQPLTPEKPVGPSKLMLLAGSLVMALGVAVGVGYIAAMVSGIMVSPRELEEAFQLPVAGTVSWEPAWQTQSSAGNQAHKALPNLLRPRLPSS